MRRFVPFGLVVAQLLAVQVLAKEPAYDLLQPIDSRSKLVLQTARGRARVESQDAAPQSLNMRADEFLTTIAETRGGWTAAGIREHETSTDLIILHRSSQGTQRLAPPTPQRHPLQLRPTLAVQNETLDGMAWLEGPDLTSLSVRAASRGNGEWGPALVVAPPAQGSQTGLVATVLKSSEWLLVWSAFDGRDDEILWSTGKQERWSAPQRLDKNNSTPDIMPALVSTPTGAMLTWSRMIDGHYQLLLSRFKDGNWSRPQVVGPPGSLQPGFAVQEGQLLLLYRHAWPRGWAVNELSSSGRMHRLAVLSDDNSSRPIVTGSSGESVELRWANSHRRVVAWEPVP